jgi:hypothetical protein
LTCTVDSCQRSWNGTASVYTILKSTTLESNMSVRDYTEKKRGLLEPIRAPCLLCSATDFLGLSGGEMVQERFRGGPVGEVIEEAVPRLSPPLLVDEAFRCPSCMPPQCEPSCPRAVSSLSRYNRGRDLGG